jgi:HlyD family secretion protein
MEIPAVLRRKAVWIVVIGLLLAVVLWRCSSVGKVEPAYVTEAVSRGEIVSRISASGSLSAVVTVEVGSQVSGRIQSLFADFNSVVRKGERIAKIDPALFEAAVEQASANVVAARGNLARLQAQSEEAARQARRATQLFDQKIVSENDRDVAVSNARAALASVQQAEGQLSQTLAALRQAQTNLRYTDILAPTDGIVISRAVNVGQTVAASLQAPVIFTIAQDLRAMEVHTNVAESDIGRLQSGMSASFTVDAYPNERFTGRIREIRNAPQVVQNVVTYDAVIEVANPDLRLKPGMTATVTVIADRRGAVLRVPNAALRFRPVGGDAAGVATAGADTVRGDVAGAATRSVFVLANGKLVRRELGIGLSDGRHTEVIGDSLRAGDLVVTGAEGATAVGSQRGARMRIL